MGGPLGDLEPYQQALDETFKRHDVVLAYLYGSQAQGDAGSLSDVDMAVQFTPDLPRRERFSQVAQLTSDLCQLLHRDDVYVVDLDAIPPLLCHRIYLNHRLLYCPDDAARVAFETRALRQYMATRPLHRTRWRYVLRRITQGRYGRLESEAQTMVDVEVIQQRLGALEEFVSRLEEMRSRSLEEWREDVVARCATERALEVAIQRVLNIATHILTADFAIPADDYAGVIRALGKAGVLPADFAERFTAIVGFRNVLTELHVEVDPVKVYEHLQRDPDDIRFFARCIVEYLERKGHIMESER
ncbi:MAG: DUF86 domain-containing protein [Anaerolineales bacterium]|nr:MAG: DUF86 domain-containing protein [Anaerolineales bacterium]